MRLEGSFYSIESLELTGEGVLTAEVVLNADHEIYAGHFPQRAVVPGVCTLTIVRECIGVALGRDVVLKEVKECKFVAAVLPEVTRRLRLSLTLADDGGVKGAVTRVEDGVTAVKLKFKV